MWKACKTMGPPPKTMPQKVMPPSLTAPIALFVVAPCFVFGVVVRCAMKLLPCKILGDARKSRQHAVFERCPNDARPDGSREHLAQATCRAKACHAHLQSVAPAAPHTASARGHAQLSGVALVPHYPPCFRAPRAAPAKHLTLPAHIVMLGPHVKRKGDGAEPGFEPGTLRLLAVRSNYWAKLALMPWDNMANSGRKLVTVVRPFQKIAGV